ncbi:hypothetical protein HMPREF1531_00797 [Propionibacterium sp. oral taxon 192 str. F0372]|uniref:hypothetical protein n=1 Tax=Propionibacterium sp. oral taxon 192 TaxID=671222 RepID=UPI0003539E4A|nr:hypothetical protein [Propionibacterium sp. oral taxon 192]EPH06148.1 hypothetical protein HMPREF1531_00797 [Propionibacterium sp. oral taxon 192 str. F0372]
MDGSIWHFDDTDDEFLAAPNYPQPEPEHDDHDPLDPTQPMLGGHHTPTHQEHDTNDDEDTGDDEDTEHWSPDKGFPDPTGAVRVWMTPTFDLQRVRVSLNWRHKLTHSSLDEAFGIIFMAINAIYHQGGHRLPSPDPLPAEPYPGPFGWHTLQLADREHAKVDAELTALGDTEPTTWIGHHTTATAYDNALTITLGIFGQPISATFDPQWLATNIRSSDITKAVKTAYKRARTKHTPPTVTFGKRELLTRKHDQITRNLLATFQHGIQTGLNGPIIGGQGVDG